jgi:flagellar biosynthesis protein FlhG
VARDTGISPSRIRFLEMEFKDLLPAGPTETEFHDARVEMLVVLHRMLFLDRKPAAVVRGEVLRSRGWTGRRARVVAVTSGKGGVGKTTVSVNLAVAFATRNFRTLLVDADMGLGNVHVLTGMECRGTVIDLLEGRAAIEDLLSDGPGHIKVLCAGSGVATLANLKESALDHVRREILRVAGGFDVVVLDTGAGISPQVLHFLRMADEIVVVATPDLSSMLDAYGVIKAGREAGAHGHVRVLVNLVDAPEQPEQVYQRIRGCALRFLEFEPGSLGHLPRTPDVQRANQSRRPLAAHEPTAPAAQVFARMVETLSAEWSRTTRRSDCETMLAG